MAGAETWSGAALRASAISASGSIMYAASGGYFGDWAAAAALATSATSTNASFLSFGVLSIPMVVASGAVIPEPAGMPRCVRLHCRETNGDGQRIRTKSPFFD